MDLMAKTKLLRHALQNNGVNESLEIANICFETNWRLIREAADSWDLPLLQPTLALVIQGQLQVSAEGPGPAVSASKNDQLAKISSWINNTYFFLFLSYYLWAKLETFPAV